MPAAKASGGWDTAPCTNVGSSEDGTTHSHVENAHIKNASLHAACWPGLTLPQTPRQGPLGQCDSPQGPTQTLAAHTHWAPGTCLCKLASPYVVYL